jgi:hypothetical protein
MANKNEFDYEEIDNPYNDLLERAGDSSVAGIESDDDLSTEAISDVGSSSDVSGNVIKGDSINNLWLNSWIKSRSYKPKSQGFLIDGVNGYIECMKLYVGSGGIIGGSMDIPDTTSTNSWHVDADGNMWIGSAAFASAPFKALNTGAVTCTDLTVTGTSTIGGRLATTIGGAINSDGDLINDIINTKINTDSQKILKDFDFGSTDFAGAVKAGTIAWNTTNGAYTGGSGVVVYRNGIVGANGSEVTFSIDTDGNAIFRGNVTALTGTIGSFNIGTYLYSGSKAAWNDSNAGVHIGSDGIGIGNNVFTVNGATGAVACSNITITGGTIQWSTVTGTGKPANNATVGATFGVNVSGGSSGTNYVGNNGYVTTITGSSITTGTLNASLCNVTNINASSISTGTLSADRIGASSITASKLSVSTLSAISASLGTITAGTIGGVTINVSSDISIKDGATEVLRITPNHFWANVGKAFSCQTSGVRSCQFYGSNGGSAATEDGIIELATATGNFKVMDSTSTNNLFTVNATKVTVYKPLKLLVTTSAPSGAEDGWMFFHDTYNEIWVFKGGAWKALAYVP